jgi:uncharacterized circularly permuted ATP-grasp superfamily protein
MLGGSTRHRSLLSPSRGHVFGADCCHDELIGPGGKPRSAAVKLIEFIEGLGLEQLRSRQLAAEYDIRALGITFTVYDDKTNIDREWPFDIIPRVLRAQEWSRIERGLLQRLTALNLFIDDLYNGQKVVRDGLFPAGLLATSKKGVDHARITGRPALA